MYVSMSACQHKLTYLYVYKPVPRIDKRRNQAFDDGDGYELVLHKYDHARKHSFRRTSLPHMPFRIESEVKYTTQPPSTIILLHMVTSVLTSFHCDVLRKKTLIFFSLQSSGINLKI